MTPMSREEQPMSEELLKQHWEAYEAGLSGTPTNEERELLLADFLNLITQARAEGAREMAEKIRMPMLDELNVKCRSCGEMMAVDHTPHNLVAADVNHRIDHLITQYQDGEKESNEKA